jgi:extradiol dioxygenase family protein
MAINPFHLAILVRDLNEARDFYSGRLGCSEGRSAETWVDFNFSGHQLVCHLASESRSASQINAVDGHGVPVPHFGIVLQMPEWRLLADRLVKAGTEFIIEPHIRFEGQPGEQATMFFLDPSGNPLEFKAFHDVEGQLFEA